MGLRIRRKHTNGPFKSLALTYYQQSERGVHRWSARHLSYSHLEVSKDDDGTALSFFPTRC